MTIKDVRKVGLWVIAGLTLASLLALNLSGNLQYVDIVLVVAIIALVIWPLAATFIGKLCHRH